MPAPPTTSQPDIILRPFHHPYQPRRQSTRVAKFLTDGDQFLREYSEGIDLFLQAFTAAADASDPVASCQCKICARTAPAAPSAPVTATGVSRPAAMAMVDRFNRVRNKVRYIAVQAYKAARRSPNLTDTEAELLDLEHSLSRPALEAACAGVLFEDAKAALEQSNATHPDPNSHTAKRDASLKLLDDFSAAIDCLVDAGASYADAIRTFATKQQLASKPLFETIANAVHQCATISHFPPLSDVIVDAVKDEDELFQWTNLLHHALYAITTTSFEP